MIGICYKGEPVYGVTNLPVTGEIFYGGESFGAFLDLNGETTKLNQQNPTGNKVLTSRSHSVEVVIPYLEARQLEGIRCGSSGVKACRLVDQTAQHYIHGTTIHEWDTASADALVRGAGGYFTTLDGEPIVYNKPEPTVEGVIATFSKNQLLDICDFFSK
jgi:3'-phosphoadenosine 5'-phosphosulfate (PAPS) 3'-phosphatase